MGRISVPCSAASSAPSFAPNPAAIDSARALATCLKPADDPIANQVVVRVWETSGVSGPLSIYAPGYRNANATDLLEREQGALPIKQGRLSVNVRGHGFAAVKLER